MTRKQALAALAGTGITGKMAAYLLDSAEKHGAGAHLKAEVTYTPDLGYVIVDYPESSGEGIRVSPRGANG